MKIKRITWTIVAVFTLFLVFGIFYLLKNTSITVSGKSETGKVRNEKGKSIQYIMIDKMDKHDYFSKLGIKGYEKPNFEKEEKSGKKSKTKKQKTSHRTEELIAGKKLMRPAYINVQEYREFSPIKNR